VFLWASAEIPFASLLTCTTMQPM